MWGLVVVCQNTRAIKIHATAGYGTDDLLTAFALLTANHENPLLVVSDSGSQLVKASNLMDQIDLTKLAWKKIAEGAAKTVQSGKLRSLDSSGEAGWLSQQSSLSNVRLLLH